MTTNHQDLARQFEREWGRVKGQAILVLARQGRFVVMQHVKSAAFLESRLTLIQLRHLLAALYTCPDYGARYLQGGDDGPNN